VFDAAGQFRADIKIDEIDIPENVRLISSRRWSGWTRMKNGHSGPRR
jgi:hypothetical protein